MAGVSGAFLILPFQMSVLGFITPAVTSTNFLYNLIGTPGGVYRFMREGRMAWPLTFCIIARTLPGVLAGYYIRVTYLPEPKSFKFFVGIVLLYIGYRLLRSIKNSAKKPVVSKRANFRISNISYSAGKVEFDFHDKRVSFDILLIFLFSLVVGVIGGIYGIGGGSSIIAPFLVSILNIPVYVVAGAVLMGTFVTSLSGLIFYSAIPFA